MERFALVALLVTTAHSFLLDREVCYTGLGCFSTTFPWRSNARPVALLPDKPENIKTRFFLYTRSNPGKDVEQEILWNQASSIETTNFNGSKPTKIIIHGFVHDAHRDWVQNMVGEFLKQDDYNVIAVDWRAGAGPRYTQSVANTRVVGAQLAKVIKMLIDNTGTTVDDMHLIGHNMGGHIAGYAGTAVPGIARITALDPVRPLFEGTDQVVRLDPSDAKFVDAIHTDASSILSLGFGIDGSVGHVDFYPNGGYEQPGCTQGLYKKVVGAIWNFATIDQFSAEAAISCSHARASDYFIESINSGCPFQAYPCKSFDDFKAGKCLDCSSGGCSRMGLHVDKSIARGKMYLLTQDSSTFCNTHYFVQVLTAKTDSKQQARGLVEVELKGLTNNTDKISLTVADQKIGAGQSLTKMFTHRNDLGDLTAAVIEYTEYKNLLSVIYSDFLEIVKIEVNCGEKQVTTRFCANNGQLSVATTQARTLGVSKINC